MKTRTEQPHLAAWLCLTFLCGIAAAAAAATAPDQNWPQWRGPFQNGVAPLADPPVTWSETNNIKWKAKIPGTGQATPIIWDTRVFVQTAISTGRDVEPAPAEAGAQPPEHPSEADRAQSPPGPGGSGKGRGRGRLGGGPKPTEVFQFVVLCLDRLTGKVLWQKVAAEEVPHEGYRQNEGSFASPSGLTDGKLLFAFFGSRGLYCYDLEGNPRWNQRLGKMRVAMGFGEGSSPALHNDTLVVNWDNEDGSFIIALDRNTGRTLWKKAREERTSWSTPLIVEQNGKVQVVVSATGKVRSYDLGSGDLLWECGGLTRNVIPSPVSQDSLVYCMSGFQGNACLAIRLGRAGDLTGTDAIAWTHNKGTPYVPSPLLYGGKLYFFASNSGVLTCLDAASGQPVFEGERLDVLSGVYASPVGAAGRIYLAGRNGATVVLKQGDKPDILATNRLDDKFDASPATSGRDLFLRGREHLYCIAQKQVAAAARPLDQ